MRKHNPLFRVLAVPFIALFVAACGGGNELPELDPDQALVRVTNNITDAPYITVSIEDLAGNPVTLGNVRRNTAENLIFLAPDFENDLRLIAVKPGDQDRDDHVISRTFVAQGGMTVNWFLPQNSLEVSN